MRRQVDEANSTKQNFGGSDKVLGMTEDRSVIFVSQAYLFLSLVGGKRVGGKSSPRMVKSWIQTTTTAAASGSTVKIHEQSQSD